MLGTVQCRGPSHVASKKQRFRRSVAAHCARLDVSSFHNATLRSGVVFRPNPLIERAILTDRASALLK
jgi:hypothetical protein